MARRRNARKTLLTTLQWLRVSALDVSRTWDVLTTGKLPGELPENDIHQWCELRDRAATWRLAIDTLDDMASREVDRILGQPDGNIDDNDSPDTE